LREENSILKKQLEINPVALEKHAKCAELQSRIDQMEKSIDP
jgi:hypothetical protein